MLHDGQGLQGTERTIDLCREHFYWNTVYKDVAKYMNNCSHCQVAKGHYTDSKIKQGSLIVSG